jgi:hypothetical protein
VKNPLGFISFGRNVEYKAKYKKIALIAEAPIRTIEGQ